MKHLQTAISSATAVCLLSSINTIAARNDVLSRESNLAKVEKRRLQDPLAFPGRNFVPKSADDLKDEIETWRTSPRTIQYAYATQQDAEANVKGTKSSWSWKSGYNPCKSSKSSKKGGTYPEGYTSPPSSSSSKSAKKGWHYCDDTDMPEGTTPAPAPPGYPSYPDGSGNTPAPAGPGNPEVTPAPAGPGNPEVTPAPAGPGNPLDTPAPVGGPGESIEPTMSPWVDPNNPGIDVQSPDSATCANVENGDRPELGNFVADQINAKIGIQYQSPPYVRGGIAELLQSISPVLNLWVAGCEDRARSLANMMLEDSERRLQESPISWVDSSFSPDGDDPCQGQEEGLCSDTFNGDFEIYHDNIDVRLLRERIFEAFEVFADLIRDLGAPDVIFDPDDVSIPRPGDTDGINRGPPAVEDSVNVGMVVGASAGGLAFILLIVLLARRKQSDEDEVSHLKLEEDGDDTFIRELEGTATDQSRDDDYETRNVHVLGEADSIFSGWTGYTKNDTSGDNMDNYQNDVHKCSSATCEVCEQRRQQGIQFIPTETPVRPQLPSDTEREYVAEDTVEL